MWQPSMRVHSLILRVQDRTQVGRRRHYAPINDLPQDRGDGGSRNVPRGDLTFLGFQMSFPHPWVSIISQILTPGDHKFYFL